MTTDLGNENLGTPTHLLFDDNGNLVPGSAALATNATNGFIYLPTCAGQPTGTPTAFTGRAAHLYDTTNHVVWVYDVGLAVWRPVQTNSGPLLFPVTGVNFNSANTDTQINIILPAGFSRYQFNGLYISGASHSLTTATCGVFSAAAGGGTAVVTSGTAITLSATTENTASNMQILSPIDFNRSWNFNPLFFRVQTAEGAAATATITLEVTPVS